jgi:hypothetical protein
MQYKPHTAPAGSSLPYPASPPASAARRPVPIPLDIATDRPRPPLGKAPLLEQAAASAPVVTRIISKPHPAPRFIVQLCQSTQPIDPHAVPQLDLFELYHLYRHSKFTDGKMRHSLRLGYFKEPGHARAIACYLAPHFRHPLIVQIEVPEIISSLREKFLPRKDVGTSGQHATIELTAPPPLPTPSHAEAPIQTRSRDTGTRSRWPALLNPLSWLHTAT